jgi:hypothetical protein
MVVLRWDPDSWKVALEAPSPYPVDSSKEVNKENDGFEGGADSWKIVLVAPSPCSVDSSKEVDKESDGFEKGLRFIENGPRGSKSISSRFGKRWF